jgi:4-aminobutyrate aminotransferase-like enzyme
MDLLEPGTLSSTHGGNPFCARVALANVDIILRERLWENAASMGRIMAERFSQMMKTCPCLGDARGQGLVWGLEIVKDRSSKEPAPDLAKRIIREACTRGLLMIAPIGLHGNVLRIAPPLVIKADQVEEGLGLLEKALKAVC